MDQRTQVWVVVFQCGSLYYSVNPTPQCRLSGSRDCYVDRKVIVWILVFQCGSLGPSLGIGQCRCWNNSVGREIPAWILVFQCGYFGNSVNLSIKLLILE